MASYGTKYQFRYNSIHGVEYIIQIAEDGYSGSVINRPLGAAPVLHMQESGVFRATSLGLTLECQVDGEFASFYTSNPLQYKVYVFRGGNSTPLWQGYLATELYAEPDIAPPYDVKVTATDGLGVLKEYTYEGAGRISIKEHLRTLLLKTGFAFTIYCGMSIHNASNSIANFFNMLYLDLDYLAGKSYYEVLEVLLKTFHATVTQFRGSWFVLRESDMSVFLNSSGDLGGYRIMTRADQTVSSTKAYVSGGRKSIGPLYGSEDTWPIGHLTRRVVPAKRSIAVTSEWHSVGAPSDVSNWTAGNYATYDATNKAYNIAGSGSTRGSIENRVTFDTFNRNIRIKVKACGNFALQANAYWPSMYIRVAFDNTSAGGEYLYYHHNSGSWTSSSADWDIQMEVNRSNMSGQPEFAQTFTLDIPAPSINNAGILQVSIQGIKLSVYSATVEMIMNKGYKDTILIDNGARGEGEEVEITGSPVTADNFNNTIYLQGIFTNSSGIPSYSFSDDRFTRKVFLALATLDRALSVALPRIELSGTLDVPDSFVAPPLVVTLRGTSYQVQSYDWDLYNEEYKFVARTSPAASLTVESETVTSTGDAQ